MISDIFNNLDWSILTDALLTVIPALLCITIHELSHGLAAYRLGDRTAKDMGRLTLNPIKHIDIFGLLMMLIFKFGWAKPVPVNMHNFKKPKWYMAITAIAGPSSNIILAAFVMLIYGLTYSIFSGYDASGLSSFVVALIERTAYLSVALAIFNLMPIPPLDGSKVLFSLLSEGTYYKLMRYERYGMILLILILNTTLFRNTIGNLTLTLYSRLFIIANTAFQLVN